MVNLIKKNVSDCILDRKRCVVEIQTKSNLNGKEIAEALKSAVPGMIKNIRYTFGTRDLEVETVSVSDADKLYNLINKTLEGKTDVSHGVLEAVAGVVNGITNVVGIGLSNKGTRLQTEAAAQQSAYEQQMKLLEMQQEEKKAKNTRTLIVTGASMLVVLVVVLLVLNKK